MLPHVPRLRLYDRDPESLSEFELLEQVLTLFVSDGSVKKIAFTLKAQFGSFAKAITAPKTELQTIEGLGEDGIFALKLIQATMIRTLRAELISRPVISTGPSLIRYLKALFANEMKEKFHCLFLDTKNRIIADEMMAQGSINRLLIYPREVFHRALACKATAIILAHNHPSGEPSPSLDDISVTKRLQLVGHHLGISIHDHIIITAAHFYSFAAEGRLHRWPGEFAEEFNSWES